MRQQLRGKVIKQRVYSISAASDEAELAKATACRIVEDFRADRLKIKPLPRVAVELGRLASSTDPDIGAALALVQREPELAGRVLKAAGSAAFGNRAPQDLAQASMRLGVRGMRDLAFAVSLAGVFRCPPLDEPAQEEVKHGFVVAVLSSYICRMMKIDASEGFLAGLFHDAGRLVVLNALAEYGRKDSRLWDPEVARRVGNGAHGALGTLLLERWGLGATVRECARHHHKPGQSDEPLATVVAMADHVDRLGGSSESERAERLSENPCPHGPGLSEAHVAALAGAADVARNDPMLGAIAG
ncbi:MAG: HDOD domain-containing protein [Nannocystales bacterium]